jgi:hypothetical protein
MEREATMEIVVFDNGGKTTDRYCLIVDNKRVYTMAPHPVSSWGIPWGARYLCEATDLDRQEAGRLIALQELPPAVLKAIETNGSTWFSKSQVGAFPVIERVGPKRAGVEKP